MKTETQATSTLDDVLRAIDSADAETRVVHEIKTGQWVRQGDVLLVCVAKGHPHGAAMKGAQLAVGESTGSRHLAEAPALLFEGTHQAEGATDALLGPCVVSDDAFRVSHPEHADVVLPAGTYQTVHQMDAATRQRVID